MNTQPMFIINFLNAFGNLASQASASFQMLLHSQTENSKERILALRILEKIDNALAVGLEKFDSASSAGNRENILRLMAPPPSPEDDEKA